MVGEAEQSRWESVQKEGLVRRAQAEAAGAAFLIAKPFTPESFDEALGAGLGAHP